MPSRFCNGLLFEVFVLSVRLRSVYVLNQSHSEFYLRIANIASVSRIRKITSHENNGVSNQASKIIYFWWIWDIPLRASAWRSATYSSETKLGIITASYQNCVLSTLLLVRNAGERQSTPPPLPGHTNLSRRSFESISSVRAACCQLFFTARIAGEQRSTTFQE